LDLVLERIQPNSALEKRTSVDLFDSRGTLLLTKGQEITETIRELIARREVYVLQSHMNFTPQSKQAKAFPKDVYIELVGSLWNVYHGAQLIGPMHIKKTVTLVDIIFKELQVSNLYLDIYDVRLDLEKYKQHDYRTFVHVLNVALLSAIIGLQLGYNEKRLKYLTLGALLHDLGKFKVPLEILNKPGSLTDEEFSVMKNHPLLGEEMLQDTRLIGSVMATVKEHHERWNGNGYPHALKGNEINQDAQIVAVADVYEALTADRPYRKGIPPYHALEMILSLSGKDFNPRVVQAFRKSLILYPKGALVTLNTGEVGIVIKAPTEMPTRPLLRLLFDFQGRYVNRETYLDLMQDLTQFIVRVEFKETV